MLSSSAQVELDQLLTMIDYHRQTGWLDRDNLDDQGKCLALCYLMQAMSAKHVVDLSTSVHPRLNPPSADKSGLGSFWVYGLEVVEGETREFVGVNGERTRFAAECAVVLASAPGSNECARAVWEEKKVVFDSLEKAKRFYSKATHESLVRLVGEGVAHLQALQLAPPAAPLDTPKARL